MVTWNLPAGGIGEARPPVEPLVKQDSPQPAAWS